MKKAIGLALAVLVTTVVAASAQGSTRVAAASAASISCKSTITLPLVTPVTGGAGFLGAEQAAWSKYAVSTLAKPLGLKVKFVLGDTPVEQGPAPAQALAQKYIADKNVLVVLGPSTSGAVAASSSSYFQAKIAHISPSATRTSLTQGSPEGRQRRLLPGRAWRLHPGPVGREVHDEQAEGQEGRAPRLPGAVLARPRRRGRVDPQEERRLDDPPLGPEHDDRLLGVRDEGAERRRHRLLPDAEAGRRADVRAAARRAGQEGEGVRR